MISDIEKVRVENCVVQIECINKFDNNDIELGTGFFIEKNIVITASHVIDKYHDNPSDYLIYIVPINAKVDKKIKVDKILENKRNNFVSILQLEEAIETINPLKFTLGYKIKRGDKYFSFGHPQSKRIVGYRIENQVITSINETQSRKVDWDLDLNSERLEDFKGFSGAPVIINNLLIGIVQTESEANGRAISIGMSSIDIMKDYVFDKYCQEYDEMLDIWNLKNNDQKKIYTIDDIDKKLKESTEPSISLDFFEIDDDEFKETFKRELNKNIYVVGKSREETLYCILNELKYNTEFNKIVIVGDEESWVYLREKIVVLY